MNHIIQQALKQAIPICAAEPIHQIGSIQPHGALLVLSPDNRRTVLQASTNIGCFIDLPTQGALGNPLVELLGVSSAIQIESLIRYAKIHGTATGLVSVLQQQMTLDLDAHVYISDDLFVVELCRDNGLPNREKLGELLIQMQNALLAVEVDTESTGYFEQITRLVHQLTGYDSVMAYRFEANWDGEVIAQHSIDTAPSYLGIHFPASDIPAQARYLYTKNLVRIVTDVVAEPVSVLPALNPNNKQPLDMTYSALRSLSPVHMEYLGNMGVQSSMVISLLQNGRLWGLISCHHMSPKRVSFAMREATIFISRMVSRKLTSIDLLEGNKLLEKTMRIKASFLKSIINQSVFDILERQSNNLLRLVNATGLIIIVEGNRYLYGLLPTHEDTDMLLNWLVSQAATENFSCDNLSAIFPPASCYPELVSGVISTSLSSNMRNGIIWLRRDKPRTVTWAGSYESGLHQNPEGDFYLSPRKSFENWTELWRGHAETWTLLELKIVNSFGQALSESLAQKYKSQLSESGRDHLMKIFKDTPDFIFTTDMQGHLKYLNNTGVRMVGLPDDIDLSDLKISDIHPDWVIKKILEEGIPLAIQQGFWRAETALLHRDGHEIPVSQLLIHHRHSDFSDLDHMTIIIRDITEKNNPKAYAMNVNHEARPPFPPFTRETATQKVRLAEDGWNHQDPQRVALAYTVDSQWRNRAEFLIGREQIIEFLTRKWAKELDYRLIKELWAFDDNRIAVRFAYEWHNNSDEWFRSYGNENWEFDQYGLMQCRYASINDLPIKEADRKFRWPQGRRPDDHLGLSDLGL